MATADLEQVVSDGRAALADLDEQACHADVIAVAAARMTQVAAGVLHDRYRRAGQGQEALAVLTVFTG